MRITLMALIRLSVLTSLVATCAAVGLSRLAPPLRPWRMPCSLEYAGFNEFFFGMGGEGARWVAQEGGRTIRLPLPRDERLDYATCSPWRDERGRSQVAGRWTFGSHGSPAEFGIARLSFPDGEVIDRVATETMPLGAPCWFPGTTARILFAAGDGMLYNYAFEAPATPESESTAPEVIRADSAPRRLALQCPALKDRAVFLSDPHWPSDSRFSRTLFVSLRKTETIRRQPVYGCDEIWWLRISEDGCAIEDGGPLLKGAAEPSGAEAEERCPIVGRTREGDLTLAYLRKVGTGPRELRALDLTFDDQNQRPVAQPGAGLKVADDCLPCPPAFSSDGRHVLVLSGTSSHPAELRRLEIDARHNPTKVSAAR
jgi:hypothetical protein